MKCPYCGKNVPEGSKFCDGCGAKLEVTEQPTNASPEAYNYQPYAPKKNGGKIAAIIIVSLLVLAGIIVGIILLVSGGSKSENNGENPSGNNIVNNVEKPINNVEKPVNNTEKPGTGKTTDYVSNIKSTEYVTKRDRVVVVLENKNSIDLTLDAEIVYYDANNTILEKDSGYLASFQAGATSAIEFYEPEDPYDHYKITYEAEKAYYRAHNSEVTIKDVDDKENGRINVTFTNNSKEEINNIEVGILFYKNGKVVGYSDDFEYDLPAGESILLKIDYPYDNNYDDLDFDDYKIYINDAYNDEFNY